MPIWAVGMLRVRNLHAYYDESHVLHGIDLDVNDGEVVTLVGRNGAGKTTTMKSIMGVVRKRTGQITYDGNSIIGWSSDKVAKAGIGYVPEERGIFSTLSVTENLVLPPIVNNSGWSLERIYDIFPALKARGASRGTALSGGEQQMLAIARILRSGSKLILLDEPTEGLAPVIVNAIAELILEIKRSGVTILLVEQNLRFATRVADRHYLMVHGQIVESMSNGEVKEKETELLAHLGV